MEADHGHHPLPRAPHALAHGGGNAGIGAPDPGHLAALGRRVRGGLIAWVAAALTLAAPQAGAGRYMPGGGFVDIDPQVPYSVMRARLIHDGYQPAKLQHDYRDLCTNADWSHVCTRFPETLDCDGDGAGGDCDFAFERPGARAPDRYLVVSSEVTRAGRVADQRHPATSQDLRRSMRART